MKLKKLAMTIIGKFVKMVKYIKLRALWNIMISVWERDYAKHTFLYFLNDIKGQCCLGFLKPDLAVTA